MLVIVLVVLLVMASPVFASAGDYDTNPGLPKASNSGQYHGAFSYYAHERAGWIPEAAQQGGLGDTTGPANSNKDAWFPNSK